jgi:arabinan endo-1,5-alpha-L-arabinosidase
MERNDINIRDPFVLVHDGKYYLYGTRGYECWGKCTGLDCYISDDLVSFSGPYEVFTKPEGFWADENFWAPEVYEYKGAFYMFASFKAEGVCRGTQILKADSPLGPFKTHSDGPVTPRDWECLDGTLYIEEADGGKPYMVFCHEWVQIGDGTVCAIPLNDDLSRAIGEPVVLFHASEAPWIKTAKGGNYVTDGPFMYRNDAGKITMLWSSFGEEGYTLALAHSDSNTLNGPWRQEPKLLFSKDGGHGMLFRALDGTLMGTLHSPNEKLTERPYFFKVDEKEL